MCSFIWACMFTHLVSIYSMSLCGCTHPPMVAIIHQLTYCIIFAWYLCLHVVVVTCSCVSLCGHITHSHAIGVCVWDVHRWTAYAPRSHPHFPTMFPLCLSLWCVIACMLLRSRVHVFLVRTCHIFTRHWCLYVRCSPSDHSCTRDHTHIFPSCFPCVCLYCV